MNIFNVSFIFNLIFLESTILLHPVLHQRHWECTKVSDKFIWTNHKTIYTPFAKHSDMDKLFKILWRGRKQGRCERTSLSLAWEIAHIYLVFAQAREFQKVCPYQNARQTVYQKLTENVNRWCQNDPILGHPILKMFCLKLFSYGWFISSITSVDS